MAAEGCWPCFPQPLGQKLMQRLCGWWNDQLGVGGQAESWAVSSVEVRGGSGYVASPSPEAGGGSQHLWGPDRLRHQGTGGAPW